MYPTVSSKAEIEQLPHGTVLLEPRGGVVWQKLDRPDLVSETFAPGLYTPGSETRIPITNCTLNIIYIPEGEKNHG